MSVSALNFNLKNFRFYRNSRETGINVNDLTLWIAYCNSISKTFSFSIPLHLRVYRVQINITFILKIKYSKHINEHITYFCNLFIITLNTEYMPVNNRNNNNINNKNNNKPHVCVFVQVTSFVTCNGATTTKIHKTWISSGHVTVNDSQMETNSFRECILREHNSFYFVMCSLFICLFWA